MSLPRPSSPAEVRPLPVGPLHFVGIGGAGQSALAFIFAQRGRTVRGSDPGIAASTKTRLESVGCTLFSAHDTANLAPDTAAVIVTDAVNESNPEVQEALRRGLPIFRRPEALATLVNSAKTAICVAGTHGKTTTSAMVACILIHAGLNPTVVIGGDLPVIGGNAQNGDPDLIVVEACEAYGGLDCLRPTIAVITNCEPDHLDFHGSEENFYRAFERFALQVQGRKVPGVRRNGGCAIYACAEDEKLYNLLRGLEQNRKTVWPDRNGLNPKPGITFYGRDESPGQAMKFIAVVKPKMVDGKLQFWLFFDTVKVGLVKLVTTGTHNVLNATAALSAAILGLEIEPKKAIAGLAMFTGTGRRFERLGEVGDIAIVDDYAHHPTEIRATLQAARQAFPQRRIVAIFQPHLPSRTRDFLAGFADALSEADAVYLTDIYLAREPEQPGLIEALAERAGATLVKDRHALPATLRRELKPGDVALFMGAGNIREQAEALLRGL